MTTGRLVVLTLDRGVGSSDRRGDGGTGSAVMLMIGCAALVSRRAPARFAARVDFLKNEVFEICGALALAESLLARLGLRVKRPIWPPSSTSSKGDWWSRSLRLS